MDPSSYRLSLTATAVSIGIIAAFFVALRRSVRLAELRWFTYSWVSSAASQLVVLVFWYTQPPIPLQPPVFAVYLATRTLGIWLLLRGALEMEARRPQLLRARIVVPATLVACGIGMAWITSRDRLGVVASAVMFVGFGAGASVLARSKEAGAGWLAGALVIRTTLAAVEEVAYFVWMMGPNVGGSYLTPANTILATRSTFDTAGEFLVAMGCVLAVSERVQRHLRQANEQVLAAQADLRRLADRDPLTALANRRALPEIFRNVQPGGATLVFFDLNDFKRINDEHGHQVGDACLQRFADALTESFRPNDAVIRYAGDEFLVVAGGLDRSAVDGRVDAVRAKLRAAPADALPIRFSYGVAPLLPGGDPDEAVRAADEAMYLAKPAGRRAAGAV